MDFRKIFFVFALLIFGNWGIGQDVNVAIIDSTVYAFNLDDGTSSTSNGLVEQFEVTFVQDSLIVDPDSLFFGEFIVGFDVKSVDNFGSVQIELAKMIDGIPVLSLVTSSSLSELINEGSLTASSVIKSLADSFKPGVYNVSILVFTTEGSALRVLTKTIIL